MRRILVIIIAVMLALTGCKNSAAPSVPSSFPLMEEIVSLPTWSQIPSIGELTIAQDHTPIDPPIEAPNNPPIDLPVFPALFTDFFFAYVHRDKSFAWEDVAGDFEAAGYWVFAPSEDSRSFLVYPTDAEEGEVSMACSFSTDKNPAEPPRLDGIGYYVNYEFEGAIVEFDASGDKYFICASWGDQVEVDSFWDIVDYLAGVMTG